jgi:hypothetical protein
VPDVEFEEAVNSALDSAWVSRMFKATRAEQASAYELAERVANTAMQTAENYKDYLVHHEHWLAEAERWLSLAATFKYLSERP